MKKFFERGTIALAMVSLTWPSSGFQGGDSNWGQVGRKSRSRKLGVKRSRVGAGAFGGRRPGGWV